MKSKSKAIVAMAVAGFVSPTAWAQTPVSGGVYTHALEAAVTCIDPPTQIFHVALNIGRQLVDSLVDQDPRTGEIVPWIAESWEISDNAQTFTFHLAQAKTFADGAPIDAAAVKANIDRVADLGPAAVGAAPLLLGYTGTTIIDDHTVRIDFDRPSVFFLQALSGAWFGLISPNDLGKSRDELCTGDFAGSGPFVLESYQGDTEVVLSRREGYDTPSPLASHDGDAFIDTLQFVIIPEAGNRTGAVQTGEVHSASNIAFQHQALLEASGVTLLSPKIPGLTETLIVNEESFIGQDEAVRQALRYAINSRELAQVIWGPTWGERSAVLGSSTPGWADLSDLLPYDPERSIALLEEGGWIEGSDGVRVKDGTRLTLRIPSAGNWAGAELLQQQLAAVGIEFPIERLDSATNTARLQDGEYELHKWQMTRADPSILNAVWNSDRTAQGYARTSPSELDDLLAIQEAAIDPQERAAATVEVQRYLIENAYAIPLVDRAWTYALHESANGLRLDGETKLVFYDVWVD